MSSKDKEFQTDNLQLFLNVNKRVVTVYPLRCALTVFCSALLLDAPHSVHMAVWLWAPCQFAPFTLSFFGVGVLLFEVPVIPNTNVNYLQKVSPPPPG